MKLVLQRVTSSQVYENDTIIGSIDNGLLILLGVHNEDTEEKVQKLVDKIAKLRIFSDIEGKTNLSIKDVNGQVLIVSQFTLYADTRKGNRPSFTDAADPDKANYIYKYFINYCKEKFEHVEEGNFGAYMKVSLVNDGPFTIIMEE